MDADASTKDVSGFITQGMSNVDTERYATAVPDQVRVLPALSNATPVHGEQTASPFAQHGSLSSSEIAGQQLHTGPEDHLPPAEAKQPQ